MATRRNTARRSASARRQYQTALVESLESRTLLSAAPTPAQIVAQSDNQFAFDLFHQLSASAGSQNIFFSPYSIATALEMTLQGANGNTAAQIIQALHLPSQDIAQAGIQALYQLFQADPATAGYTLSTANRLWVKDNFQLLQSFLDTAQNLFGAQPQSVDFSDPVAAAGIINAWVSNQTHGKIPALISPDAIDDLTRLILTNAIYFKGTWQNSFNGDLTRQADFTTAPGQSSPVQMMFQNKDFGYYAQSGDNAFQAIDLPYTGNNLDMLVILPGNPDLTNFDASLTPDLFNQISTGLHATDVNLYLPRFELKESYDLVKPLQNLGITDAFSPLADFSGITDSAALNISDVVHQSFLQVDEQGSEAAAATGVIATTSAVMYPAPPPPPTFDANHPFLVAIRDHATGTILFLGQVTNPGNFTDGETPPSHTGGGPILIGSPTFPFGPVTVAPPAQHQTPARPGSIHLIPFVVPTNLQAVISVPATPHTNHAAAQSLTSIPLSPRANSFLNTANGLGNAISAASGPALQAAIEITSPPLPLKPFGLFSLDPSI